VRLVEENDLTDERLESLAAAPVLFQEYVPGTPVRAYVVGRRVPAAAEIISPEIDYRRQEDAVIPTALSREERAAALAATRACGMQFTGVDLIRMPKGFRVLECNPSPMFGVFEEKTGLDVAGPLAELLLST
jgi:glutathione synthase/RimK-type ligase-like ATP-grasp enzyme